MTAINRVEQYPWVTVHYDLMYFRRHVTVSLGGASESFEVHDSVREDEVMRRAFKIRCGLQTAAAVARKLSS